MSSRRDCALSANFDGEDETAPGAEKSALIPNVEFVDARP
jgi:hypothetical protein